MILPEELKIGLQVYGLSENPNSLSIYEGIIISFDSDTIVLYGRPPYNHSDHVGNGWSNYSVYFMKFEITNLFPDRERCDAEFEKRLTMKK